MLRKRYLIGLTGGIASGKSAVSEMFSQLGAYIIDADVISHELSAPGTPMTKALKKLFPEVFISETLDRAKLREIVFNDNNKLGLLNSVTHKFIFDEIDRRIEETDDTFIVVVIPLLFETAMEKKFDAIICVSADMNLRIDRLKKRDNINDRLAVNIIAEQLSDVEREKRSNYVIRNDGNLTELKNSVLKVYEKILAEI